MILMPWQQNPQDFIDSTDARAAPFLLPSPWGGAQESVFSQVSWLILLCTQVENLWPEAWEVFRKCLQNELSVNEFQEVPCKQKCHLWSCPAFFLAWHWAMLPWSHSLDLAWAACSVPRGAPGDFSG